MFLLLLSGASCPRRPTNLHPSSVLRTTLHVQLCTASLQRTSTAACWLPFFSAAVTLTLRRHQLLKPLHVGAFITCQDCSDFVVLLSCSFGILWPVHWREGDTVYKALDFSFSFLPIRLTLDTRKGKLGPVWGPTPCAADRSPARLQKDFPSGICLNWENCDSQTVEQISVMNVK